LIGSDSAPDIAEVFATIPVLADRPRGFWTVTPLPSLTNRAYRVNGAGGDYVLRVGNSAPYLDRQREAHNHRQVAGIGLAPSVIHDDPATGVMVTAFEAEAKPFDQCSDRDRAIAAVGRAFTTLHGSGLPFEGEMRLIPTMEHYLGIGGTAGAEVMSVWERWRRRVEPVVAEIESRLVPSHVDPVPQNILVSGSGEGMKIRLVDWEYSAPAAAVWDLADFAIEAALDPAEQMSLLSAYGDPDARRIEPAFNVYKPLLDLLAAAWAASQMALPGRRAEHGPLLRTRLARATEGLEADGYGASLEAAAQ